MSEEIKEMEKNWNEMVYNICDGDPVRMREIIKFDVFDFFAFLENTIKKK